MYIEIVRGTYGHRPNPDEDFIEKKGCESGVFEVSEKEAARLVSLGIAREVPFSGDGKGAASLLESGEGAEKDDGLEQLPITELRKLAKALGLPADGGKAILAGKIRAASGRPAESDGEDGEQEDDSSENESPPALQAAEPEV